ncbi:hypothetical protein F2P81_010832 [Scophthalmus maximus]|uniref:F-box domain-containing protein n=1 Tax=Scophthalmus maximus TaxID=52904 RepID=A0A6A4T0X1_SCOMX|nr:hypothetical protein F2P81_010832 [Scophthalmus maximus]
MDMLEDEEEEEEEGEEDGHWDSDPEPPVLLVSDLNDDLLSGSYLTVTLQRPHKAKRQSDHSWLLQLCLNVWPRMRGHHGDRGTRDCSASSSEEQEAATASSSLSPPSLLSVLSFKDEGNERGGEKEVWVSVFRFLSRAELLACMTVCKAWYKWSCDKRLWSHVDVSRCSPLSNQALAALVSPTLPHLRLLDLRWCEGLRDAQMKEIISPPGLESSRSRLRNVATLRLSGLDVSESSLRLLQRHMPQLERLDLAHCKDISDSSIALLAAAGTHTRNNLTELTLAGCSELTDGCLSYLKRLSSLTLLDLRGCKGVSRRACDVFISDLSHVALYCMMEEKLIQRLD